MSIYRLASYKEAEDLHKKGMISSGTLSTAKFAFQQGKPVFVGIPDRYGQFKASEQSKR